MQYMQNLFASIPQIEKVVLYGSRATGNFEKGSDVDLAVFGELVTYSHISYLKDKLENESPMLLKFDVLHFDRIGNEKLKKRIKEDGVEIYKQK